VRKLLTFLFLLIVSTASHASYFYRMDTRPPDEIFHNGFTPGGTHPSIFQHVIGETCQTGVRTTGFVAVSSNETFAVNWGSENQPVGARFYVYRIRASEHFYNAVQSLLHARRQTNDMAYEIAAWRYMAESEWVTPVAIPADDIIEATEYVSQGRDRPPQRIAAYQPEHALDAPGTMNHDPFTWDYLLDRSEPAPAFNPLCPATCFGTSNPPAKRSAEWFNALGDIDEARKKMDHILECVGKTAAAALGRDLLTPEGQGSRSTEL